MLARAVSLRAVAMTSDSDIPCGLLFSSWFFWIGVMFFFVSFMGVIATSFDLHKTLLCYMVVSFVCTIAFATIIIVSWATVVLNDGEGNNLWKMKMGNPKKWAPIHSCLVEARLCESLTQMEDSIYLGCCRPPKSTFEPTTILWVNDTTILCYRCESCKDAVFTRLESDWKKGIIGFSIMAGLLVGLCVAELYFYKKGRQQPLHQRDQQPPQQQQQEEIFQVLDIDDETYDDSQSQTEDRSLVPEIEMASFSR